MLRGTRRNLALTAGAAAVATALAVPAPGLAKSYKTTLTVKGTFHGATLNVVVSGTPLGRCTGTGQITANGTVYRLRCKGGTVRMRSKSSTGLAEKSRGRWAMLGGTGRYRHIGGSGTFTGRLSKRTFTLRGTVRL